MTTLTRALARTSTVLAVTGGLAVLGAATASAHVGVTPTVTTAGASSVLTFSVGHGCDGSPTTAVDIQIPDGIYAVTPTVVPGWTVRKVPEKLPAPVDDGHGGQYTERVTEVVYTAQTPLEDGYRTTFPLALTLPDAAAGDIVAFPTVQTCVTGETAWVQPTVEGEDEPENPAPAFALTAAPTTAEGGDGHGAASDASHDDAEVSAVSSGAGSPAPGWIGLGLGAVGAVLGGAAFVRTRRSA